MSGEPVEKKNRAQSSFSRVLHKLSEVDTLDTLQKMALRTLKKDISICTSTSEDEKTTLCFVADTSDEEGFSDADEKLEDILGYTDRKIIRQRSETPQRFASMYQHITLLSPENVENVKAFIPLAENPSHKIRK